MKKIALILCLLSSPALAFTDQTHLGDGQAAEVGNFSTIIGFGAAADTKNCNAYDSTFVGSFSGNRSCGPENTFIGEHAGSGNEDGSNNTAMGSSAYSVPQHGYANTALGVSAMQDSAGGNYNVAVGNSTLNFVTMDTFYNTAIGGEAGYILKKGSFNTMLGAKSEVGEDVHNSTALGAGAVATKDNQIMYGDEYVTENVFHGSVRIPGKLFVGGAEFRPMTARSNWISFFLGFGPPVLWFCLIVVRGLFRRV